LRIINANKRKVVIPQELEGSLSILLIEPGVVAKLHRDVVVGQAIFTRQGVFSLVISQIEPGGNWKRITPSSPALSRGSSTISNRFHTSVTTSGGNSRW
jgi:hypothetical protein